MPGVRSIATPRDEMMQAIGNSIKTTMYQSVAIKQLHSINDIQSTTNRRHAGHGRTFFRETALHCNVALRLLTPPAGQGIIQTDDAAYNALPGIANAPWRVGELLQPLDSARQQDILLH